MLPFVWYDIKIHFVEYVPQSGRLQFDTISKRTNHRCMPENYEVVIQTFMVDEMSDIKLCSQQSTRHAELNVNLIKNILISVYILKV